ncbi:MAG: hypothetical protein ABIP29_00645 [Candidatus Eisenbacteria bacterium]
MSSSRLISTAGAILLVGALSGCGSDNPVSSSSLQSSPPSAPTNLRFQQALLTWDPSPDANVIGYEIEADFPDPQVSFVPVSPRMTAITAFDVSSARTEWDNTWYRVRAVNVAGTRSAPSNSVYVTGNPSSVGAPEMPEDPPVVDAGPIRD